MPKSPESVIKRLPEQDDYAKAETEIERPPLFSIWYIEPGIDKYKVRTGLPNQKEIDAILRDKTLEPEERVRLIEAKKNEAEAMLNQAETWLGERDELWRLNDQRTTECIGNHSKRPYFINDMRLGDLYGEMEIAYNFHGLDPSTTPEIIFMRQDKTAYESGGGVGNIAVEKIRQRVHQAAQKFGIDKQAEAILQPLIVLIIDNPELVTKYLDQGADLVMPEFKIEDIKNLVQLAAKIKSDPASLAPEKVMAEKKAFYKTVEGLTMGDRSKITADTEQELEILRNLLPQKPTGRAYQNKKSKSLITQDLEGVTMEASPVIHILDIGCGTGRISNELATDKKLNVVGLEGDPKMIKRATAEAKKRKVLDAQYIQGDLIDYSQNEDIEHGSKDAVIYTWHSFLEAFGPGNTLRTLKSAWLALKEEGILIFDQPTRENSDLADGWYYNKVNDEAEYLSYIMTEAEIEFMLRITGFEDVEFTHWQTEPSELYPKGMKKITVKAKKKIT